MCGALVLHAWPVFLACVSTPSSVHAGTLATKDAPLASSVCICSRWSAALAVACQPRGVTSREFTAGRARAVKTNTAENVAGSKAGAGKEIATTAGPKSIGSLGRIRACLLQSSNAGRPKGRGREAKGTARRG